MKKDLKVSLFKFILHLKEEKVKEYTEIEQEHNIIYVFKDLDEFKSYFTQYGLTNESLMEICIMKKTKKGSIIALKSLCDYSITRWLSTRNDIDNNNGISLQKKKKSS